MGFAQLSFYIGFILHYEINNKVFGEDSEQGRHGSNHKYIIS